MSIRIMRAGNGILYDICNQNTGGRFIGTADRAATAITWTGGGAAPDLNEERDTGERLDGKPVFCRRVSGNIVAAAGVTPGDIVLNTVNCNFVRCDGYWQPGSLAKVPFNAPWPDNPPGPIPNYAFVWSDTNGVKLRSYVGTANRAGTTNNYYVCRFFYTKN